MNLNLRIADEFFRLLRKQKINKRNIIPKYNVIKYINQLLYQLLATGRSKHDLTIEVIFYDFFISSFGLKSLAKKKLS